MGVSLGPVWAHFGNHFFDVFLMWLFDGLGLYLGSQKTSKMRPKRGSTPKAENHRFCPIYITLAKFRGAENQSFFNVLLEPHFGMPSGADVGDFDSLLGSLLETMLVTFWVPFLH